MVTRDTQGGGLGPLDAGPTEFLRLSQPAFAGHQILKDMQMAM